jgi:hypothetical protein
MRQWYEEALEDRSVEQQWMMMHRLLFKKQKSPAVEDLWLENRGVSQPSVLEDSGGSQPSALIVVSREHIAMQVKSVIECRENWLQAQGLAMNTRMNNPQIQDFLAHCKNEYHSRPDQVLRQEKDREQQKKAAAGKKQRWARNLQRLAGSTQMWQILSFTGQWDPQFIENLPPVNADEPTEEQKQNTKAAAEARAKYRLALSLVRLRQRLADEQTGEGIGNKGEGKKKRQLGKEQKGIVELLENGTLLREANRLTKISGNGRLRRDDNTFIQTGGSTGGYVRTIIYDWTPPDTSEFEEASGSTGVNDFEPDWTS